MNDAFKGDTWINDNSQIAAEKLHALGVIAYRWNTAEIALKSLLIGIAKVDFPKLWTIIHETGDVAITTAIIEMTRQNPLPFQLQERVEHGLKLYDANRINRNQLTHFMPAALEGSDLARLKGPTWNPEPFPDKIEDLRRVADDVGRLLDYFSALITIVYAQHLPRPKPNEAILLRLPDIIPLPERLWKPLPPNPPKPKGQPGSSRG
jgi:hypothetical protein